MPNSSELIDAQYLFEEPRGLLEHNTPPHSLHRLAEELGEVWEEIDQEHWLEAITEVADVVIFAHSILGFLARKLDMAYEEVDRIIEDKMASNQKKYHISHFEGRSTKEAMEYSRKVWKPKS